MAALNIIEAIRQRAPSDALAVIQGDCTLTFAQLFSRCDAVRALLPMSDTALRIGIDHPGGIGYIATAMAVLAAGHCMVPLAEELAPQERADLIRRTALHGVITAGQDGGVVYEPLSSPWPSFAEEDFAALNPAFIRFSSGTTGTAKGVLLSHESLLARIQSANDGLRIRPGDRVLWVLPMAHHFAVSIVLYLYFGATTVIDERRLGHDLLRAGQEQDITVMYGSPVHYRQLVSVASPSAAPWPHLRLAVSTAAALDAATAKAFRQSFGRPLVQGLGIIEVGLPLLDLDPDGSQAPTLGPPQPRFQAKVDALAQLCLRGPGMFDAYLDPWQPRAQVLDAEGWFATGDLAEALPCGRYRLLGRVSSMINVGGMKVFPEEVERILDEHPGIRRSLVSGRAHPVYGEVPIAHYEAEGELDLAALRKHCRMHLAAYKIPLLFTAVDALPTTASGKLLRRAIA
jgi:long-chain acyl-CoA synthetase